LEEAKPVAKATPTDNATGQNKRLPLRARLPGFIAKEEIGLGDVIKRATSYIGIRPCGGCEGRAAALNHRLIFGPRRGR
jgi:hypothetical protein